ncbi:ABC transporter permease [Ktedonospora formicarum]|uniref:ABC-2 type transporter transmembrane domain-containing protein n=1 Tax=Ktedonospora formicarum TaxID=2778364 RepID=A0A8J3MNU6_9CHLR|nr:ABC transporter permease [Ktedonospora formicarum]GHO43152.1 hypothetical protein KSX_13150 [Ktedonospora formicarum]
MSLSMLSLPFTVLYNETRKRFLIFWDYRFNVIVQLLTVMLIFVGVAFFFGRGSFNPQEMPELLIGYVVWFYARIVIIYTGADLVGEASAGTLEQMYMSPVPVEILLIGRMLAMLFTTTILVLFPTLILMGVLHIALPLRWESIPVILLTLLGFFGFTLILTGAGLVFKQVESLGDLAQNIMLFMTGALLPVSVFPSWLAFIAKTLPITQGIIVLREVLLTQTTLAEVWWNGDLTWLLFNSLAYCFIGWVIFKLCEQVARRQGTLGQY